jgi:pyruvate dehydrogenase E2 component (dihydrolipoamide acetyltransferase)
LASEVVMPRLGWTMEVGRVVEWLKQDGDAVEAGDFILAIESDKAVSEIEALDSGILRIPSDPQIGVELPVGARLGFIVQADEPDPFAGVPAPKPAAAAPDPVVPVGLPRIEAPARAAGTNGNGSTELAISPRARRVAVELGVDWTVISGSGSTGRIRERDIRAVAGTRPATVPPRATPSVRRLAEETGIDLAAVPAGRPGGRVTRSDVLAASAATPGVTPGTSESVGPVRRVIIERMTEAARTVAPVTLTTDADATELARLRTLLKDEMDGAPDPVPSFNDLIARLVALTLVEHPGLNATLQGDRILRHEAVHIGIAVDTDRGLLVPIVRDADHKGVHQIAAESSRLIEQTRAGTVPADDLKGSTFTITNLGMYGIDAFTPIINLPECAILGVGRIQARPVVIDEESESLAVRKMMALSLTFDHRVVDGAPAARFLQALRRKIEHPYTWLIR